MSGLLASAVSGYTLRSYQQHAVDAAVAYLTNPAWAGRNGLVVDLVGLKQRFGPIEQLWMQPGGKRGKEWVIVTGEQRDRPLTNSIFGTGRSFAKSI